MGVRWIWPHPQRLAPGLGALKELLAVGLVYRNLREGLP